MDEAEPILFEECYVLADSQQLIDQVKNSQKMLLPKEDNKGEVILKSQHLYVFAHGFQGNQNDLRGIKN